MKIVNTFIVVADDSAVTMGRVPPLKTSLARLHFDLLSQHPYEYDLDALNFEVYCRRNGLSGSDCQAQRDAFLSRPHPCMRGSPLTRIYGFGAHYNGAGKIAIYPVDSRAYGKLAIAPALKVEKALRTRTPESVGDLAAEARPSSAQLAATHPGGRPSLLHPAA